MTQQPWGQPQQQYQPAPYQPQPAQQQPGPGFVWNSAGPSTGGGENPRFRQLIGRLLLIRPLSIGNVAKFNSTDGSTETQIIADCLVLDGPPITGSVNGKTHQETPFSTGPKSAPFYVSTLYIKGAVVVPQLQEHVASRPMLLNRLTLGEARGQNDAPFLLIESTPEDQQLAAQVASSVGAGTVQQLWDKVKAASTPQPPAPAFGGAAQAQPSGPPLGQPQPAQAPWQQPAQAPYPQQGPPAAPWQHPAQAPYPQQPAPW